VFVVPQRIASRTHRANTRQVNLGNARTLNNDVPGSNIVKELELTGNRYNIAVAVFFVPYVIFEAPSNFAMKYFSPSVWIGRIMISWGIITICTSAVSSYGGLLAIRFCLGVAEAGFFPGRLSKREVRM
jgi:MFS family permease